MSTTQVITRPAALELESAPRQVSLLTEVDENTHRSIHSESAPTYRGFWSAGAQDLLGIEQPNLRLWSVLEPDNIELFEVAPFTKTLLRGSILGVETLGAEPIIDSPVASAFRSRISDLVTVRLIGSYFRQVHESIAQIDDFTRSGRHDWALQRARSVIRLMEAVWIAATERHVVAAPSDSVADRIASVSIENIDTDRLTAEISRIEYSLADHVDQLPESVRIETFESIVVEHRVALLCGGDCS